MEKIKKSITINAPVEKVYEYIKDVKTNPEWMPSMVEVYDSTGTNEGDTYKWKYKMAGIIFKGETAITEQVPNKMCRTKSKGGITSEFLFEFEPKDKETQLELTVEYNIPVPVVGKLAEKTVLKRNEREAELAMQNIKDKMES